MHVRKAASVKTFTQFFDMIEDAAKVLVVFANEAGYTPSVPNSKRHLQNLVSSGEGDILIVYRGITPVAVATVTYDSEHQEERFGYILKFYVVPEARKSEAGRVLTRELTQWFDERQCHDSFVTSTAMIGQNKLFENLMAKSGYRLVGGAMKRRGK